MLSSALVGYSPVKRQEPPGMPQLDPRWLAPDDAAAFIGVARATLFRMLKDGRLSGIRQYQPHKHARYLWQPDLEAWMKKVIGAPVDDPTTATE